MATERTDNLREELDTEDQSGAGEATENTEDTSADDQEDEEGTEGADDAEDTEDESGDDDEDEESEADAEKAKFLKKFEGKSREEILESYRNLEKRLGKRAISNGERKALQEHGVTRKDLDRMSETKDELEKELEAMDFSKMDPKEFAKWMLGKMSDNARRQAEEIYRNATTVQNAVRSEIAVATEKHPLLKSNKEYRDLVLAIIESGQGRGEVIPLLDACKKVDALIGNKAKVDEQDKKKIRATRAAVESTERTVGDNDDEETRIKRGILNAGQSTAALGGLGV